MTEWWKMTPAQKRAYRKKEMEALAERLGTSVEGAQGFVEALPYSCIPVPTDAEFVLDAIEQLGWGRLK